MIIALKSLTYKVNEKKIVRDISLDIINGDIVSIVGPNGSGKTTLIRMISGEIKPSVGTVSILNKAEKDWDLLKLAQHRSVLSQSNQLSFPFSVLDIVKMGRHPYANHNQENNAKIAKKVLKAFKLDDYTKRNYTTLSGGEKQRVQIARVITQLYSMNQNYNNKILILDEPSSYLDINHQEELFVFLKKLNKKGLTIIMVLHDLNQAIQNSNKIIMLKESRLIDYLKSEDLVKSKKIEQVFDIEPTLLYNKELKKPILFFKSKEFMNG